MRDPIGTIRGDQGIVVIRVDRSPSTDNMCWLDPVKEGFVSDEAARTLPLIGAVPYTPADTGPATGLIAAAVELADVAVDVIDQAESMPADTAVTLADVDRLWRGAGRLSTAAQSYRRLRDGR